MKQVTMQCINDISSYAICSFVCISYLCSHMGYTRAIADVKILRIVWEISFSFC